MQHIIARHNQRRRIVASIRKRKWLSGGEERVAFVADYFTQDGKRVQKQFARRKDADAFLTEAKHEVRQGMHTAPTAKGTVAEAGALWIEQAKADGLEPSTWRMYQQHLDLHIDPVLPGSLRLGQLAPETVEAFRTRLLKAGRSPVMVKKILVSLGSLLACAQDLKMVSRNVVHERTARRKRKHAARHERRLEVGRDIPTMDEIRAMLNATGVAPGWRALVVTLIFTGLRCSEARALEWRHLELDGKHPVLHVRQRADKWKTVGSPKSRAGTRDVPLAEMVVNTLRQWRGICPRPVLPDGSRAEKPVLVFPTARGTIQSQSNMYRRGLGTVQKAAGISKDTPHPKYGLHALRHAAASLLIAEEPNAKRIQAIMGHSTIAVTFDTYGHLFPTPESEAMMARVQKRLVG
jgi:integrase